MTYYDSAEGERITYARAQRELDKHGIIGMDREAFNLEVKPGKDGLYDAQAVLGWLGY